MSLTCDGGQATAASQLRGLVPGGVYSVFVVHLNVQGPARFTPFGDTGGTMNNFTASTRRNGDTDDHRQRMPD